MRVEQNPLMKIQLIEIDQPELKNPIIISGLPGSAFVGKFAIDHLIADLSAKPLAEIYADSLPSQVLIKEDGSASLLRNDLLYWKNTDGEHDAIFFTGDAQPSDSESEYSLSEKLIEFVRSKYQVRLLITLGAYVTGVFSQDPKVYATGTRSELTKTLEAAGCLLMREGAITGMNGLLLGVARLKGVEGYSLLGETTDYSFDPRAAEIVLE
ncbi:MAG TPA: PAC2 family protein, partial [Nitrososphaerales archaeon]|nr:PAC2 family protein [Nitrososphaerales archaeon]